MKISNLARKIQLMFRGFHRGFRIFRHSNLGDEFDKCLHLVEFIKLYVCMRFWKERHKNCTDEYFMISHCQGSAKLDYNVGSGRN